MTIATTFKAFLADEKVLQSKIESLQKARQAQEDLARSVEDTSRELQKLSALTDLQEELNLIGLYGDELEKQTRLNEINRNLRQEQQQLAIELLRLDKDRNKIGELNYNAERQRIIKQMADAVELSEARIATFEEEQKRKTELENSYAEGAKRALQDMAEQMKPLTVAQDAVKRGFDALGDAIDDFVETGKFSFKQFAASVIADIAKIVAKALVLQAIKTIFGGFGIPGLAEGGPAKAGKPYIVGEKGPELFVPKTSGTVVPNNAMKNGVATGAVNAPVTNNYNTYNINAVDAKSVAQLFAENRKVLLGTVKMAERELPYMA
jgi:lambda family phage tail tape measure protein